MKKYKVTGSFSLLERVLIIETDEIYAEKIRERLGTISSNMFINYVQES